MWAISYCPHPPSQINATTLLQLPRQTNISVLMPVCSMLLDNRSCMLLSDTPLPSRVWFVSNASLPRECGCSAAEWW